MKKIIVLLVCISTFMLSGCKNEKVSEDQRMGDSNKINATNEYNRYVGNIMDSGYNWYSKYVNSFLESIKSNNYSVGKQEINAQIEKVNQKIDEIKNIDISKIKKSYDNIEKDSLKNEKDVKFSKEIKTYKKKIIDNRKYMEEILNEIKKDLELGNDGKYTENDIKEIQESQVKIIGIFDKYLKGNY